MKTRPVWTRASKCPASSCFSSPWTIWRWNCRAAVEACPSCKSPASRWRSRSVPWTSASHFPFTACCSSMLYKHSGPTSNSWSRATSMSGNFEQAQIGGHYYCFACRMDSMSGSLRDSEPTSPTSPGSPDPTTPKAGATSPLALNHALNTLMLSPSGLQKSTFLDSEALILIEVTLITGAEPMHIANIQFNNLDIIGKTKQPL